MYMTQTRLEVYVTQKEASEIALYNTKRPTKQPCKATHWRLIQSAWYTHIVYVKRALYAEKRPMKEPYTAAPKRQWIHAARYCMSQKET